MQIHDATATHAEGIAAIYNHAVEHTTAIWNDQTVDSHDRADWISARQADGFPVLVAVDEEGEVLGYASYGPWRPHDGYRHTVEHSVYVREGGQGRGTGGALLRALLERAERQSIHVMIAGVDAENEPSLRMHERFGFERTGVLRQVGTKFGRWLDLAFLQLVLDHAVPTEEPSSSRRSVDRPSAAIAGSTAS